MFKEVVRGKRSRRTTCNENEDARISCEVSNSHAAEEIYADEVPNIDSVDKGKKKKRGPSKLNVIATGIKDRKEVEFNEFGQPIGLNSIQLSSMIGILARECVPVTHKGWDKVTSDIKDQIWEFVTQKYNLEECRKAIVLGQTGRAWKDYKSKLSTQIREEAKGPNSARHLTLLKPPGLKSIEWDEFVKSRLSPEFDETSDKHKEARAKQIHPHTTSRRGYARLKENMKAEDPNKTIRRVDVWIRGHRRENGNPVNQVVGEAIEKMEKIPSHDSTSLRDDAVVKVLGPERPGHVRGLGFGVTPTKVDASLHSNARVATLENQIQQLLEWKMHMESRMTQGNERNVDQHEGGGDAMHNQAHTLQCNRESSCAQSAPQRNSPCKLLHWLGTGEEVASAELDSTDPKSLVHHQILGPDCYKVWVVEILVPKVPVFRYSDAFSILDDAKGSTIAWPHRYIRFD